MFPRLTLFSYLLIFIFTFGCNTGPLSPNDKSSRTTDKENFVPNSVFGENLKEELTPQEKRTKIKEEIALRLANPGK